MLDLKETCFKFILCKCRCHNFRYGSSTKYQYCFNALSMTTQENYVARKRRIFAIITLKLQKRK